MSCFELAALLILAAVISVFLNLSEGSEIVITTEGTKRSLLPIPGKQEMDFSLTNLVCPPHQTLVNEECHFDANPGSDQCLKIVLLLFPQLPVKQEVSNLQLLPGCLYNYSWERIEDIGMALLRSVISGTAGKDGDVKYIRLSITVIHDRTSSLTVLGTQLQNQLIHPWKFTCYNEDITLTPSFVYPEWKDTNVSILFHKKISPKKFSVNCVILYPRIQCPLKPSEDSEYSQSPSGSVHLKTYDLVIAPGKYFINKDNVLLMCVHDLDTGVKSVFHHPLLIVTLISFLISVLCLCITLLTYILLKELRTIPGINIMFLCTTLLVAQASFVIMYFVDTDSLACTISGVFNHFIWLSAFTWMTVCSVHVYRIFRTIAPTSQTTSVKSLVLKYALVGYGCPAIITVLTVIVTSQTGEIVPLHKGPICFIDKIPNLVSTVLPVGLTIVLNFALLVLTVRAFKKRTDSRKGAGQSNVKIISHCVKLSTITSLTWVLWIISKFWDAMFLDYLVACLCGGQGLLIFIAFVANRKVLKLYKSKCCGKN